MTPWLAKLKEAAQKATKNGWSADYWGPFGSDDGPWVHHCYGPIHLEDEDGNDDEAKRLAELDAAHIASWDPQTALLVVEVLELVVNARKPWHIMSPEQQLHDIDEALTALAAHLEKET